MTTITAISGNKLTVRPSSTSDAHIALECADHDGRQFHGARVYQRKDLLAAFGIDELGCGCEEADENLDAALKRAEAAEAEALEQAGLVRTFADRAEAAEADLANSEPRALCNELREKLAEANRRRHAAEATIQRVREWLDGDEQFDKLDAILNPVPPFTLPTEVPATIEAMKISTLSTMTLALCTDGSTIWWADPDDWGPFWTPEQVMREFAGHRLIGADE